MALETYRKKRDFTQTPEPAGKVGRAKKAGLRFVIQKHDASRLHYDFRLELDGVLKSWAVPKGPSLNPSKKSLAVQVEDHPLDYGEFEGVIPENNYGGGTVLLWDTGTWEPVGDPREGLESGKLHLQLHGEKLHGEWGLIQMHGGRWGKEDGKNWLLFKVKDKHARKTGDILAERPESVKTQRKLEDIADDRDAVWSGDAKEIGGLAGAEKSSMPAKLSPQLATLAESAPRGDEWLHEIKFDGYRILAFIKRGKVTLRTRNGKDYTGKFPAIARAFAKLSVDSAIIDGEVVVLDKNGVSDFQSLQAMLKDKEKAEPVMYAFDLPFCDGYDLTHTPLIERKQLLERVLNESKLSPRIVYSDHTAGDGDEVVQKACGMNLEGIISKRADARYVSRRDGNWLKSKCGQRQEFVIIGYTDPQGARSGFGSLLLGYYDDQERLVYAGRVGTGFDARMLADMHKQLEKLAKKTSPTDIAPPARERKHAHWVKPQLVGEVRFTGWTRDGVLRHPSFVALRSDKLAQQIVREKPIEPTTPAKPAKVRRVSRSSKKSQTEGELAGVRLTHPEKVLYPEQGVTKHDVAAYYEAVAEWMLPHVAGRPLALVRCPSGRAQKCFFQRNWSATMPDAIGKVDVSDSKKPETHVTLRDLAGVVSLVQMGVLEIHTWNCRNDDIEHSDQLIFDLDPGPDVAWKQVIQGARTIRKTLTKLKLPTFLKTTGGKGLHITIPIKPNIDWDPAKSFCETIAKTLAGESDLFVANMRKDLRGGRIYIDYHRNGRAATAVAPYSTRAREGAPVSMPISWEELGKLPSASHFTVDTARRYLDKRRTDPWRDFDTSRVDLLKLVGHLDASA